jgi:hypothetical protein
MFAAMLTAAQIQEFVGPRLVEKVRKEPPRVGDLVHVFVDERAAFVDGTKLTIYDSTSDPNALQGVPLGIVIKEVHETTVEDRVNRRQYELDVAVDPKFLAVRRLSDNKGLQDTEWFQLDRCISAVMLPKLTQDAISNWPTPAGQRKLAFGVPFADSKEFLEYGQGNLYLTAKSSPGAGILSSGLPSDDFARTAWTYEAGMLFRLDDGLLNTKMSGQKALDFAKEANFTDGGGQLMLLGMRTFKYDLTTGDLCSYAATDNALAVVMAYVTTASHVVAYARCKTKGTDVEGPTGPVIYEIPFRKLSYPDDYQYLDMCDEPDEGNTFPVEMVDDILKRLVKYKGCGPPARLESALNVGSPLGVFSGGRRLKETILTFNAEVNALCSRSLAA